MSVHDERPPGARLADPDNLEADRWVTIGEAAARDVEHIFRDIALHEHPASGRTVH